MLTFTVTRRWYNVVRGDMAHEQQQRWSPTTLVFCPACGERRLWTEQTGHYSEDNAGDCYICAGCGHSFHYCGLDTDYIDEAESTQILVALRQNGGK